MMTATAMPAATSSLRAAFTTANAPCLFYRQRFRRLPARASAYHLHLIFSYFY